MARKYGMSLWGQIAKIFTKLLGEEKMSYFLKTISLGDLRCVMIKGKFKPLKAINTVAPEFTPLPHGWGKYWGPWRTEDTYFLLAQFREVGEQPPDPIKFTARSLTGSPRSPHQN